jgi:hypothetical protein
MSYALGDHGWKVTREPYPHNDKYPLANLFEPGADGHGKPFVDDDWFRFFPDGTYECHELCSGCEEDGTCPFHPHDCDCSGGGCQVRIDPETGQNARLCGGEMRDTLYNRRPCERFCSKCGVVDNSKFRGDRCTKLYANG